MKWTALVMTEFFAQGDKEASLSLNVSLFMNRNTTNIGTCQVGFIDLSASASHGLVARAHQDALVCDADPLQCRS